MRRDVWRQALGQIVHSLYDFGTHVADNTYAVVEQSRLLSISGKVFHF
jgi:hypothetical protein